MKKLKWFEVKEPGFYWEIFPNGQKNIFKMDTDGACEYVGSDSIWWFSSSEENVPAELDAVNYIKIEEPEYVDFKED